MATRNLSAAIFASWALMAAPASAHHSFAMFDNAKTVVLSGTAKEFQWSNPHSWLQVIVEDGENGSKEYSVEMASPNVLSHNGWKVNSIKPGDKIKVSMHPLKNGDPGGSCVEVVLADGAKLSVSAGNTDTTD